jgi:hypothetical protein
MTPEHNEYVLSTAYHSGWINLDQYHAAVAALQAMPHLSAIDFLLEQTIINPGQAEGLRQPASRWNRRPHRRRTGTAMPASK